MECFLRRLLAHGINQTSGHAFVLQGVCLGPALRTARPEALIPAELEGQSGQHGLHCVGLLRAAQSQRRGFRGLRYTSRKALVCFRGVCVLSFPSSGAKHSPLELPWHFRSKKPRSPGIQNQRCWKQVSRLRKATAKPQDPICHERCARRVRSFGLER